jgi:UDP-N-acetylglucosamine 2-epimerase (non-hydrolysing)
MRKIIIVVGTRPNFIKVTQFKKIAAAYHAADFDIKIVHTGQHYDTAMADVFFEQFQLAPDFFLDTPINIDANTQFAEIMMRLSRVFVAQKPDMIMVVGDVNSTLAAALAAHNLRLPIAHLESGLRSHDRTMPEEINRILTDQLTDYFLVTEPDGTKNLTNEGINHQRIFEVGNTMIDTMVAYNTDIENSNVLENLRINADLPYALMTMHRPANVDNIQGLQKITDLIQLASQHAHIIFAIHPRTHAKLQSYGLHTVLEKNTNLTICPPMDYFAFQKLISHSTLILTDSGGIQEEATFRQKPCLTFRENTERPCTITQGSNELMAFDLDIIEKKIKNIIANAPQKVGTPPHNWDGNATRRVLQVLQSLFFEKRL